MLGQKPLDIRALRSLPTGQDAVWGVLRATSRCQPMTVHAIAKAARADARTTRSYLERLAAAGVVTVEKAEPVTFRLARDLGRETPRFRPDGSPVPLVTARQQIWNALKVHRSGTAEEIAQMASVGIGVAQVDVVDARHYLGYLQRAGYLAVAAGGQAGRKGRSVFRLVKDTGPEAPKIQRARTVFDVNLGEVVWAGDVRDEQP
jgi:predicted ArsR family transcriptional regulator